MPQRQRIRLDGAAKSDTLHRMKILTAAIIATAILIAMPVPSWAGGSPAERPDAEAMIKACYDQTIGKAAWTTAANREAQVDFNLCLEERIIDQFRVFRPDLKFYLAPNDDRSTIEKVREQLEKLREPIQGLYGWIYQENPGCNPSCGTQYDAIHLSANGWVLRQMLKDIVQQRIENEF